MNNNYFIILSLLVIIYIIKTVKDNKLSIHESLFWICGSIIMLFLSIFPKIIDRFAIYLGIEYPPSLLFVLCIIFLVFINFRLSKKIAKQDEKIICLAQELAIIKRGKNNEKK